MGKSELGSGTRVTLCAAAVAPPQAVAAARIPMQMRLRSKAASIFNACAELVDDAVGRQCRAFLPAGEMAGVIAGEVDAAIGDEQNVEVRGGVAEAADPGAEVVRNLAPADVDGLGEVFAVAWME